MSKSVHFLTGIRSEYDILAPVIEAVSRTEGLNASVIATGAHLSSRHGLSVRQLEADGHRIAGRIESLLASDSLAGRVKGISLQLAGLTDLFSQERPDFLVVMGDREESITGALAALYHDIAIVHIGGGDHADDGNVDNPVRHAVSKMAHLHMATTPTSGRRLKALGEEDWRIHVVGASGLDRLLSTPKMSREEVERGLGVSWKGAPYVVLLFHPTIRDFSAARQHCDAIMKCLEDIGINVLAMMPNSDPGNEAIIASLEAFSAARPEQVCLCRYLERVLFVNALRHAHAMVGNSSSGILEAPSLGLPAVNIGVRQRGREHAKNVIFTGHGEAEIKEAVNRAVFEESFRERVAKCETPYGKGDTGQRIARVLAETECDNRLMHKRFIMGSSA